MTSSDRRPTRRPSRRPLLHAVAATAVCAGALASASGAQAATATWSCSADAVVASVAGMSPLDPVAASRVPCSDQSVGLPNTTNAVGLAPTINARTAYAVTAAKPPATKPLAQTVTGAAGVEGLSLTTGGGGVVIGVDAAQSAASASCANGTPVLTGTSLLTGLTINGQKVTLDGLLTTLTDAISNSPLGGVVSVKLNEQVKTGDTLVQRAAHIRVLSALGAAPLADVIIAQSTVSSASACDPNATGNTDPTTGSGTGGGTGTGGGSGTSGSGSGGIAVSSSVCPAGSTLDPARTVCIISASRSGGQGEIVIGRPFTGPSGGTVISLINARKRYRSVCLSGPGPRYAIVGTNGANRITGRNTGDRILALGGNDQVDGGRGDDCVDGGSGRDNLAGGIGNDRLYGSSGGDALNGGPGKDRLSGGTGNDSMNAAFGTDTVLGGSGVDFVNVATAGPAANVDCGSGRDKVRFNKNEARHVKHCETRYMLDD